MMFELVIYNDQKSQPGNVLLRKKFGSVSQARAYYESTQYSGEAYQITSATGEVVESN